MREGLWPESEPSVSRRFYCPEPPRSGRFSLQAEESRHLLRVCRHVPGDVVEIFDGRGFATAARIVESGQDAAVLVAEGPPIPDTPAPCILTLATAIPKGDRFDWLVEKATELGVARLIPLRCEHSVVDPRGSKLDRLRRTIVEACKQAGRNSLMVLDTPSRWTDLVASSAQPFRFLGHPAGLPPSRWPRLTGPCEVVLAIGPEGGLSPAEHDLALAAGWLPIRLAPHVLRVETAGLAGAAALLSRCEPTDHGAGPSSGFQPVH